MTVSVEMPVRRPSPHASKVQGRRRDGGKTAPVMRACGHDMHVAWLTGATALLAQTRHTWRGTLMGVFQPAQEEETARGREVRGVFRGLTTPRRLGQGLVPNPPWPVGGCPPR
jgi:hippurate hydrolase